jgi:hypothetical protein
VSVPADWGRNGREGLVVEFVGDRGDSWVGNFKPGMGGIDGVWDYPDGRHALVIASGDPWLVDPSTRAVVPAELVPAIFGMWPLTEPDGYLIDRQGLAMCRLGESGLLWHTRRISWDGIRDIRIEGQIAIGQAYSPVDDAWYAFEVDLRTGRADGGSYTGPPMWITGQ